MTVLKTKTPIYKFLAYKLPKNLKKSFHIFKGQLWLQGMAIAGIVWLIIFMYVPMYGIVIAFKDYRPGDGFFGGAWVGFKHFEAFFADKYAWEAIRNTLYISFLKLVFGFPAPIIFAMLLNEIRASRYKKLVQSVSYLPFFISWVVMVSMLKTILGVDGPVNDLLISMGTQTERIPYLGKMNLFRLIAVTSDMWKGVGWGSIIYLAAITNIPQDMYESAYIDGASRLQRALRITLPSIMPTVTIFLILAVAGILGSNFEQHLLMSNGQVIKVSSTIDTYVYERGLIAGRYSFATAISLSRSLIAFMLLFAADRLSRFLNQGENGLFGSTK